MLRSQSPMKRTIALLVEILEYMRDCEYGNPGHKVTMNELIEGVQAIPRSAHLCRKMASELKFIREFNNEKHHKSKCYQITALGDAFIEKAKSEGLYIAWYSALKRYNTELQSAQEKPSPN